MAKIVNKQYIIAIGASAGGLEAISAFFDYTPLDAVSYILIQHLAYNYKSMMVQILARHSKLEVLEVTNNIKVASNKVYLIPSANFMTIKNGMLVLSDKKDKQVPYMTIDHFFSSLAEERGDKAIGVILSGTGNDGSKGIEAIKAAGGVVFVQDPDSANYNEMPLAAIHTGCADRILTPETMPKAIEDYVSEGKLRVVNDQQDTEISKDDLAAIINLIKGSLPLDFTDYKSPTILRRVKRRMEQQNLTDVDKYLDLLKRNPKETETLANDFLIGVTSFFRDAEAFKIIEKTVIPDIIDHKSEDDIVKIWVAGCSTGEEAYTLAILVKEYLNKVKKRVEVKIFATDINKTALNTASAGVYNENIEKVLSKERLESFFTNDGTTYTIKNDIRKMLIFAQHDLSKNPPYCNIDLISCRNLLIYLNVVLQKKVFSMMHFGLKKDGYLFLGPSENASVLKADFNEVSSKWNILKSNKSGRTIKFDTFASSVVDGKATNTVTEAIPKAALPANRLSIADDINTVILEESGFSGVCTDENLSVVQSFGDLSLYLKNEIFNFNLNDLLPDDFAGAFKAAAHKALKSHQKVTLNGLSFRGAGQSKTRSVDVTIRPLANSKSSPQLLLILFIENKSRAKKKPIVNETDIEALTKEHLISLESELAQSKQNLETAYERIASTNENMQSFNEELLSANEEMQSANEEMQSVNEELQSVNEELQTVNSEHQLTIAELTELNDDLNNYFRSNTNGQLFVDRGLLLKKYSPGAVKHINIRESDIGRPLSNITTNIKLETLIDDIKQVLLTDETIMREAVSGDGKIYQVMTMPYVRKHSKKSDGAIVSFHDITELRQLLSELNISNQRLQRINGDLDNFVYTASHDLNAPIFNIEMVLAILNKKIDIADPAILKLSEIIDKNINIFKSVVKDLAKVGTIEAEMLEESGAEDFMDIFKEIQEIISENIKLHHITLTVDFGQKDVRFAKKHLRSVLLNLITNAIKFRSADRPAVITVRTEKRDGFVLLEVKDNGIGIDKARIDYIFKMYHRISEDVEGQGIGLFLIKKIVDASGGKIEVESEVGKGSTFSIFFKI